MHHAVSVCIVTNGITSLFTIFSIVYQNTCSFVGVVLYVTCLFNPSSMPHAATTNKGAATLITNGTRNLSNGGGGAHDL